MAVININSGGPEGKEREFGLTWSSDLPSVRKPYTRKAHIPEDDVVFKDAKGGSEGYIDIFPTGEDSNTISGTATVKIHLPSDMPEVFPYSAFEAVYNITEGTKFELYVPAELVADFKAATGWSDYADVIFAEPEKEETQEETPGEP